MCEAHPVSNGMDKIITVENKKDEKLLRQKTRPFDFSKFSRREAQELVKKMRGFMKQANGVGLSANQIGLNYRVFVAQVPDSQGHLKFYAIFNPEITKTSNEKDVLEEGCLSVPHKYGAVERWNKITLTGFDSRAKKIKIKAWGLLARVFQHEVDHLDGKLFIDKAKSLQEVPVSECLKKREEEIQSKK